MAITAMIVLIMAVSTLFSRLFVIGGAPGASTRPLSDLRLAPIPMLVAMLVGLVPGRATWLPGLL